MKLDYLVKEVRSKLTQRINDLNRKDKQERRRERNESETTDSE